MNGRCVFVCVLGGGGGGGVSLLIRRHVRSEKARN